MKKLKPVKLDQIRRSLANNKTYLTLGWRLYIYEMLDHIQILQGELTMAMAIVRNYTELQYRDLYGQGRHPSDIMAEGVKLLVEFEKIINADE